MRGWIAGLAIALGALLAANGATAQVGYTQPSYGMQPYSAPSYGEPAYGRDYHPAGEGYARVCPRIYSPVCSRDGRTYPNSCDARNAGARVRYSGACRGAPQGGGVCPYIYQPVCGVNGRTYSNSCVARNAGVPVRYEGQCRDGGGGGSPTLGHTCAGIAGLPCSAGEYCDIPPPQRNIPDGAGVCRRR